MKETKIISQDTVDYDDITEYSDEGELSGVLTDAMSEAIVAQAGIQTMSLQTAMDNYASWMNESANANLQGCLSEH